MKWMYFPRNGKKIVYKILPQGLQLPTQNSIKKHLETWAP